MVVIRGEDLHTIGLHRFDGEKDLQHGVFRTFEMQGQDLERMNTDIAALYCSFKQSAHHPNLLSKDASLNRTSMQNSETILC